MNNENTSPFKKNRLKVVIIVVVSVAIAVAVLAGIMYIVRGFGGSGYRNLDASLREVASLMEQAVGRGDGYPTTIPSEFKTPEGIEISGGGSFDGTSYCVTATLVSDTTKQAYVNSSSSEVREGSCETATDLPKPGLPGAPSFAVISSTQIVVSWRSASDAAKYTVQCSPDETFEKDIIKVETTELLATCNELKDDTIYYARVRAENSQPGDWTEAISVRTSKLPELSE